MSPAETKSETEPAPKRGRLHDAEGAREAILNAAEEVFARHGFDGARVDAIALAAGYNKSLIFQYYGDKLGLYDEVIRRADRQMSGLQAQVFASFTESDIMAQPGKFWNLLLAMFIKGFFNYLLENPRFGQILLWEMAEGWQTYSKIVSQRDFDDMEKFMPILLQLRAAGFIRSDPDPMSQIMVAELICPMYLGLLPLKIFLPDQQFSTPEALASASDFLAEFICRGIIVNPAENSV